MSEKWWPSKWGADDIHGSMNMITPERILTSLSMVKTGKYYDLSHV